MIDWQKVLAHLKSYPAHTHRIQGPCSEERIVAVQAELGPMPNEIVAMLRAFNGAKLFKKTGPLVSVFGISLTPPLSPLQWAPEWHIDKFTPKWRANGAARDNEWAIAMMNYGGLIIVDQDGTAREWDTARATWSPEIWKFDAWIEKILREGDAFINDE